MDMCHGVTWRRGGGTRILLLCLQLSLCLGPVCPTPGFLDIDACPEPRVPEYGIRTPSAGVFFESAITRFHCLEGYTLKGPPKKQCVRHYNGSLGWKPSDGPVCLQKVPGCLVPHVEDAEVRNKTYRPGDKLIMSCHDGFQTRYPDLDNMASVCQDDGSWDNLPICQGCLRPLVLPHSFINISEFKSSFPVGRVVYYQCFPGYKLEGAEFLECMYNLIWSDRPPKCLDVEVCPLPPMVNHGDYICHPQPCESYIHGTVVEFYCDHGYTLTNDYRFITCRDGEWMPSYQVYCVESAEKSWPGAQETLLTTWKILAFTATSVLLVLLLVLTAKSFQSRFKAYFLPRDTLDRSVDPDFVVVDGVPVMLPSYDEAVSSDLNALTPGHCPSAGQGPAPCIEDLNPPAYPGNSNTGLLRADFQRCQNSLRPSELLQNLLCSSDCQTEEHSVSGRTDDLGVRGEALPIEASTSPSIDIADEIPLVEEGP